MQAEARGSKLMDEGVAHGSRQAAVGARAGSQDPGPRARGNLYVRSGEGPGSIEILVDNHAHHRSVADRMAGKHGVGVLGINAEPAGGVRTDANLKWIDSSIGITKGRGAGLNELTSSSWDRHQLPDRNSSCHKQSSSARRGTSFEPIRYHRWYYVHRLELPDAFRARIR